MLSSQSKDSELPTDDRGILFKLERVFVEELSNVDELERILFDRRENNRWKGFDCIPDVFTRSRERQGL